MRTLERPLFVVLLAGAAGAAACSSDRSTLPEALAESCIRAGCHAEVEQIHYGGPRLGCVDCHLGNPDDITKEGAHVTVDVSFNRSTPGKQYMNEPSLGALDDLPKDVIRFLNPSDYRVAEASCTTSKFGGATCHGRIVETSLLMTRATLAGQLSGGGFIFGVEDHAPRYGVRSIEDVRRPSELPKGVLGSIARFPPDPPEWMGAMGQSFYPAVDQLCLECHLNRDGPKIPGRYYSSGCSGCHMVTSNSARAETLDPTQDREELGHVQTHRFTNLIPDEQCAHCHISHLGRSLLVQGVRERSEPEGDTSIGGKNHGVEDPEHHVPWGKENYVRFEGKLEVYGKPYPFFIADEDGTNDVDETPPDVHTERGMGCIDCHNIRESHGTTDMVDRMDRELDVRCESCHGRPGERGTLHSDAGLPFARAATSVGGMGDNPPIFEITGKTVRQLGRFTNVLHPVTQITDRIDPEAPTFNPRTLLGCAMHSGTKEVRVKIKRAINDLAARDPDAVAREFPGMPPGGTVELFYNEMDGRTECFACHNSWTLNCYGCHMVRDDRRSYTSRVDGLTRQGLVTSFALSTVSDSLALGFNAKSKITPMVGTSIYFTHVGPDGRKLIDAAPLPTGEGMAGAGNVHNPVHHHTIRKLPRDCDGCHPLAGTTTASPSLLTALGLGSGRYNFEDGSGRVHQLDQLVAIDVDGDNVEDDLKLRPLPSRVARVRRLVGTTHRTLDPEGIRPHPGPLDIMAINRALLNRVVKQRK